MKNIFPLLVVLFFLTGCEKNEPGPDPHADWKVVDIPTDIHFNKVFFVNEQTGFVAGTFKFQKLKVVISTVADEGYWWYVENVHIITDSTANFYRTIETVPEVPEPSFFKTNDGGKSWESLSGPFVTRVTDIFFLDESYGFVTTSEEGVFKTTDGGKSWQKVLANIFFAGNQIIIENPYSKLYFIDKKQGFAFSEEKNIVVKTNDGGESWSLVSSFKYYFQSSPDISNIFFPDNTSVGFAYKRTEKNLLKTEDGGETWNRVSFIKPGDFMDSHFWINDFSFLSESMAYFLSSGGVFIQQLTAALTGNPRLLVGRPVDHGQKEFRPSVKTTYIYLTVKTV